MSESNFLCISYLRTTPRGWARSCYFTRILDSWCFMGISWMHIFSWNNLFKKFLKWTSFLILVSLNPYLSHEHIEHLERLGSAWPFGHLESNLDRSNNQKCPAFSSLPSSWRRFSKKQCRRVNWRSFVSHNLKTAITESQKHPVISFVRQGSDA